MTRYFILFGFLVLIFSACKEKSIEKINNHFDKQYLRTPNNLKFSYYNTPRDSGVIDTFFGVSVSDYYRYLEQNTRSDKEKTAKWIQSQKKISQHYLTALPKRQDLKEQLQKITNYERYSIPTKKNSKLFYFKNTGSQAHPVLYMQKKWNSKPEVLVDPNAFSSDGHQSIAGEWYSKDGNYLAYAVSSSGSDWKTVSIVDTRTKEELKGERIDWLRYSGISWASNGFYYSRYAPSKEGDKYVEANQNHQVYFHKLGTKQEEDRLIYQDLKQAKVIVNCTVDEQGKYLFLTKAATTSGNALSFKSVNASKWNTLVKSMDKDYKVIGTHKSILYLLTNTQASRYRLIAIDLNKPNKRYWKTILKEHPKHVLKEVKLIGGKIVAKYSNVINQYFEVFSLDGLSSGRIRLPQGYSQSNMPITLSELSGDNTHTEAYYAMSSYIMAPQLCKFDVKTLESTIWRRPKLAFNLEDYQVEYKTYLSNDSTEIPISIIYKKGLKKNGNNPTLLYAYGGFNISILPEFAWNRIPFLEAGGIYVVANIRGGGEYGEAWHKAGTQLNKQQVFDDFIAAAEFLIKEQYTRPEKLAIEGRSNGGLLIGASITQRPGLFRVAFPIVGVLDMLRYHRFTIGHMWAGDYGTVDEEEHFRNLHNYSPVHNVKKVSYPATLVMTADHDDRVVPAHSYKFISELQAKNQSIYPCLIRIDEKAGHGNGKSRDKQLEEETDKLAFLFFNLEL